MTIEHDDELRSAPPAPLEDVEVVRAISEPIEFRAYTAPADDDEDDDDRSSPGTMCGVFSSFGDWYEINSFWEGHFIERIAPGAFKRTIQNRSNQSPVRVLLEHGFDPQVGDKPLGIPSVLEERSEGAYAEVPLFDTSYNRDLIPALRGGAYGQSFRFRMQADEWAEPDSDRHEQVENEAWRDLPQRTITELRLIEFGPTVFPANPNTNAGVRSVTSTTDEFYEQLRRRDPDAYDDALARTKSLRVPTRDAELQTGTSPDDQKHSEEDTAPADVGTAPVTEDPPKEAARTRTEQTTTPTKKESVMDNPMTVEERVARQSEIRARLNEIDSEYAGSTLPPETQEEFNSLTAEYDDHEDAIQAQLERRAQIEARAEDAKATERPRQMRGAPHVVRKPENIYDLAAIRQQAHSFEELPHLYKDYALRAVEQARFPGVNREDAQTQAARLLDTVDDKDGTLARRILATGSPTYDRAFGKAVLQGSTIGLNAEEQRVLSLGVGGEGGFAVPFQLDPTVILTSSGSVSDIRSIARVEQIVGKEWDGVTSTGITVSRALEAAESSDNAPALLQPTVKAERVQGFVPFSVEIEMDWSSLRSEMSVLLADAKNQEENVSFITGNGTPPNANGLIATLGAGSNVTADTFTVSSLYALEEALGDRFRDNARFLANRAIYNDVRQFDTTGGASLWVQLMPGQPRELIGYPTHYASAMPTGNPLAVGDRYLVLGDFRHFLIVDRVGMDVELVPHLLGPNRRPTGQRGLYAIWRNNSKVLADNAFRVLRKNA